MRLSPREILERLVAFPTVSDVSNLELIAWVEDYLAGHGVESVRVPAPCGTKSALYAHTGGAAPGGVVLSGHSDVVPVIGQDWSTDPWVLTEADGRLYGRGTCDMKGFVALAIWALVEGAGRGLGQPLQLALSYDEEIGCEGASEMIDRMLASGLPRAETVIVGEPSMMKVVTGHKGGAGYHVHVRGHEVHSSLMDRGVNAIMEGARLIDWANAENARLWAEAPGPLAAAFDPPWTTLHVGMIEGGTAHNITAGDCRFGLDVRVVPGESVEDWKGRIEARVAELDAGLRARHPGAGVTATPFFTVPPLVPEQDGAAERLTRRLTGDNGVSVVSYGTEAGHFQARGYSVVVCGPGSIEMAHQADEYISVAQMTAGEAFMERLLEGLA